MSLLPTLRRYNVPVFFTKGEEIDLHESRILAQTLKRNAIPIAVDVANVRGDYDCSIENIWGFTKEEIDGIRDTIENHLDLKTKTRLYTGISSDADDSWSFKEAGWTKGLSFIIPVNGNFHTKDCNISLDKLERNKECLKWLIAYFIESRYGAGSKGTSISSNKEKNKASISHIRRRKSKIGNEGPQPRTRPVPDQDPGTRISDEEFQRVNKNLLKYHYGLP